MNKRCSILIFLINLQIITSASPDVLDAGSGGKVGNAGAQLRVGSAVLDAVYGHAMVMLGGAFRAMVIPEIPVPLGGGTLTIKNTRVTEAKMAGYDRYLAPPNRIRSRINAARLVGVGQWQFSRMSQGQTRQMAGGAFRAMVINAEIVVINQLERSSEAKPTVKTDECTAYLAQFRVEIDGFSKDTIVIENCDNLLCKKIRSFFEDEVCDAVRKYIKNHIDQKLATFPSRINLNPTGQEFILDYGLLQDEPKVTEKSIQGYLEGRVLSSDSAADSFYANALDTFDDARSQNISFLIGDFAFNTLFRQAHAQQYRFSAIDLLQPSPIRDSLKLKCPSQTDTGVVPICIGSLFDRIFKDDLGDLVFKSQWPLQVILGSTDTVFGVNGGLIEIYGAVGSDENRELLAQADVQWIRGNFTPKMNGCNVTGHICIKQLQLTSHSPTPIYGSNRQTLPEPNLAKLTQLAVPVLTKMINTFFDRIAQFPIPLIEGVTCNMPKLSWKNRTIQVNSGVRSVSSSK